MMRHNKSGFTIVELMLSVSFIAVLLIAITLLTIQMTSIYNKGLTIREANQAGQFIASDVQRALNDSFDDGVDSTAVTLPDGKGGRLCTGSVVYAWNFPAFFSDATAINRIGTSSDVRFVRFSGNADTYCKPSLTNVWEPLPSTAKELLSGGNANVALHSVEVDGQTVSEDSRQTIYYIRMVVGTANTGLLTADGSQCRAEDDKADQWCAINEFTFTARSGSKEDS